MTHVAHNAEMKSFLQDQEANQTHSLDIEPPVLPANVGQRAVTEDAWLLCDMTALLDPWKMCGWA